MFEWLILHTLVLLALCAAVLALGRALRLRPALRHALWLVVLVKFVAPPLVHWPWALPLPIWAAPAEDPPAVEAESAPVPTVPDVPLAPGVAAVESPPGPSAEAGEEPAAAPAEEGRGRGPGPTVAAVLAWLAGAVVVVGVQVARLVRVERLLARARPTPAWLQEEVGELAGRLGVRAPRVRVLPGSGTPFVWGCGPARLAWPEGLGQVLSAEGRAAVLVHELAHLRRRDHWVGWLLLLGGCVWWWHPLYRLVRRRLGREAELACDAWVVRTLPGARRPYAEALLDVCQLRSPAAVPALGVAGGRRDLERRLVMVMREPVSGRPSRRALLGVAILALVALPAWTSGQAPAPPAVEGATPRAEEVPARAGAPGKAAKAPTAADSEKKLRELEKKVQELLQEIKALRTAPAGMRHTAREELLSTWLGYARAAKRLPQAAPKPPAAAPAPVEVTLTRATYKLPAGKAEALGQFLREHVKASVLETKADGDSLVVTTTPEVQRAIGQFVRLLQGRRPAHALAPLPAPPAPPPPPLAR